MLLRVLELGYDNEFQTQIFSLIVTKICEGQGLVFTIQHVVGHVLLPEANCIRTVFTFKNADKGKGWGCV